MDAMHHLLGFLDRLSAAGIAFTLDQCRSEAVLVRVDIPGERWEVEFFADGEVDVEIFRSDGEMHGAEWLERLFEDPNDQTSLFSGD